MSSRTSSLPFSLNAIRALAWREFVAGLRGPGIYITMTIAALVEARFLSVPLDYLAQYRLLVSSDPIIPALLGAVVVAGIYASVSAAACIVQERERKTLRGLFFTPIDYPDVIAGKFLAHVAAGWLVVLVSLIYLIAASVLARLQLEASLISAVFLSVLLIAAMVAFGLAVSAYSRSAWAAILLLFATIILLFGLQVAARAAEQLLPLQSSGLVTSLVPMINAVVTVAAWISPLSYTLRGLEATALGSLSSYAGVVAASLVYIAVFLVLAVHLSRWKGVVS